MNAAARDGRSPIHPPGDLSFTTLLELAPVSILLCEDPEGRSVRPNRRAAQFFRIDADRNLSRHPSIEEPIDVLVSLDGEWTSLDRFLLQRAAHSPASEETAVVRCPSGKSLNVCIAVAPLTDEHGELRGVLGSFSDVTELKRLTEQAETHARQQAAIARLALYAVAERDVSRIMKRMMESCTSTFGIKFCKILELDAEHGVLRLRAGKGWKRGRVGRASLSAVRDGSPDSAALHAHRPVIVRDFNEERQYTDRALFTEHGIVSGVSVVIEGSAGPYGVVGAHADFARQFSQDDVNFIQAMAALLSTALQRSAIEEQLDESRARLTLAESDERMQRAARLAALGTLAAGIAHEINNPLNSILMNAEMGQMVAHGPRADGNRLEEIFTRIIDDCRRCAKITSGVLQFARSDENSPKDGRDINEVVRRATHLLASILPLSDLKIELTLVDPPPPVAINETEMEQSIVNLMRNAVEAGATCLRVSTMSDGDHVIVSLEDNGRGIPTDAFGRLFDPFFSTRREQGGTGLSLSLVHSIVQDHGGTVSARNGASGGAQFEMRLPIAWTGASGNRYASQN